MTAYYLDTSALSKRYVRETGSGWVRALFDPGISHLLLTARVTMVEFYSALARRQREGSIASALIHTVEKAFVAHSNTQYDFVELDIDVVQEARGLLQRHSLRAYDAVQLASAIVANQSLLGNGLSSLTFVSADERLNEAAQSEGLAVENPNNYP